MKIWYITNALLYQAIWFSCILWSTVGPLLGLSLLAGHLLYSPKKKADFGTILLLLIIGLIIDGTLNQLNFISFTKTGWPIPLWLAVIWMGLGATLNHSLKWLEQNLMLTCLFGGLGGPLAYWAGVRLGAATFTLPLPISLVTISLIWSFLLPAVTVYRRKIG